MTKTFCVDTFKCVALGFFAGIFLLAAVALWCVGSWAAGGVFLALALVYAFFSARNGARVTIGPKGVSRKFLWFPPQAYTWDQLAEVGVFGTKLFHKKDSAKVGSLYLYFSDKAMTEDERFQMVLRWPPKQIYCVFAQPRLEQVQYFWDNKIASYNAGELKV